MDLGGEITRFIDANRGAPGIALLAASAAIEYVFPPFPGDTVTLFGAFLVARRGWPGVAVFLAILAGSAVGFMFDYWVGRKMAHAPERLTGSRFARFQPAIADLTARFSRRGAWYLVLNRFIPSLRGLFFVAAGMAGLPARKVLLYGTISAALWNALLFAVGASVGANWDELRGLQHTYGFIALVAVLVVGGIAFFVWRKKRAQQATR